MIKLNSYKEITCFSNANNASQKQLFNHRSKIKSAMLPILVLTSISFSSNAFAYPDVKITNNTVYPVSGKVQYESVLCKDRDYTVSPGQTWTDTKGRKGLKNVCLVGSISGKASGKSKNGEKTEIITYDPDIGTSYSKFQINAFGDRYKVFSEASYKKATNDKVKSPGFKIINKTNWPVAYSLEQVGCLYHGVLPARYNEKNGQIAISTGAVWFTLRAHIRPDGTDPQGTWDCIKPVAQLVADVAIAVGTTAATVVTAGAAAPAAGAAVAQMVAKQALKTAIKVSIKGISKVMAKKVIGYISEAGTVTMGGQYAGYDWPFKCDKMPEYHITGGPGLAKDEEGNVYLTPGTKKFTVTKVNGCGNDMMLASPKSKSATTKLPFPTLPTSTTTVTTTKPATTSTTTTPTVNNVTVYQHCNFGGYAINLAPGKYTLQQLAAKGVKNDDISSIKVPKGMSVKAYQHDNFKGKSWDLTSNESCFVSKGLNDVVSAIEVSAIAIGEPAKVVEPAIVVDPESEIKPTTPVVTKPVNGMSVKQVNFNGGSFVDKGQKRWVETGSNNETRFNFNELGRDEWSVYLKDSSRNVSIQLDLWTKKIMYNVDNDPRVPLYNISSSK